MSDEKKIKKSDDKRTKARVKPMSKAKPLGRVPTNIPNSPSRQPSAHSSSNSSFVAPNQDGRSSTNAYQSMQIKIDPNSNPGPLATRALQQLTPNSAKAARDQTLLAPVPSTPFQQATSPIAQRNAPQSTTTFQSRQTPDRTFPDGPQSLPNASQRTIPAEGVYALPSYVISHSSHSNLPMADPSNQRITTTVPPVSSGAFNRTSAAAAAALVNNGDNVSIGSRASRNMEESRLSSDPTLLIPLNDPQREQKLKCCRDYLRVCFLLFICLFQVFNIS